MTGEKTMKKGSLEMWLGSHLNKIGVIFLVCGVALLLGNQYQHFTPLLKILTGLLTGGALIAGGVWFEKKSNLPAFGYVLSAGGWALTYLTAYASYHVQAVRIIGNPLIALVFMMAVSCGAVLHFLRLRSELITTLSLSLAFMTTCFSSVSLFTLISCALLVISLVYIVTKMRWYWLFVAGLVAAYSIYEFLVLPNIIADPLIQSLGFSAAQSQFWLTIGFSSLFWGAFSAALFSLDESTVTKKSILISASLINCIAYVTTVLNAMGPVYPEQRFTFVLSLALAYCMSSSRGMRSVMPSLSDLHTVFALFLATLSVPLHFSGYITPCTWLLEAPLLAWIGLKYNLPVYTRFAAILGGFNFMNLVFKDIWQSHPPINTIFSIEQGLIIGTIGALSFLAAFGCHRWFQRANNAWTRLYFFASAFVGSVTALYFGLMNAHANLLCLGFITSGGLVAALGFRISDLFVRRVGESLLFVGLLPLVFGQQTLAITAIGALALPLIDSIYKPYDRQNASTIRFGLNSYILLLLGVMSVKVLGGCSIGTAWTLGAMALLLRGFSKNDRAYRKAALAAGLVSVAWLFNTRELTNFSTLFGIAWHDITAISLIAASALTAYLYQHAEDRSDAAQRVIITSVSCAYLVVQKCFSDALPKDFLPLAYASASAIPILTGMTIGQKKLRTIGWTTGLLLSLITLGADATEWNIRGAILLSLLFYVFGLLFKNMHIANDAPTSLERHVEHVYSAIASAIMTLIIGAHGGRCISLLWALQGLSTLVAGFASRDKFLRVYGLGLVVLVAGKLLLVDMATMEIAYRIMSFIAVGLILLVTSYFYVRFPGRAAAEETVEAEIEPEPQTEAKSASA